MSTIQPCPGCAATNQVQVEHIAVLEAQLATAQACENAQREIAVTYEQRYFDLTAEHDALREALCMIYDKWEDGPGCQEGFDGEGGYIGNAVQLDADEENQILALIPKERDAARKGKA